MIIYIVIIVTVFRSTNHNLMLLSEQMSHQQGSSQVEDPSEDNDQANIIQKHKMFKRFKLIMLGYLIATMSLLLPIVLFFQYFPWVYQMLLEFLQMIMFICIGWTFRLRNVNIYYRLPSNENGTGNDGQMVELETRD